MSRQNGGGSATQLAESVMDASKAIAAGRSETRALDSANLDALRDDYAQGRLLVDAGDLADRILDDAFGEELV